MKKICKTCVFEDGSKCKILHQKILKNCFAWADEVEEKKREDAIVLYSGMVSGNVPAVDDKKLSKKQVEERTKKRRENQKKRAGKTVKQVLDESFNWFYLQGLTDEEIAEKLYVDKHRVCEYRNRKNLPAWKKKTALR